MSDKKFKKMQYKSEFNAGAYDFERFDTILRMADDLQCRAVLCNKDALLQYYAVVRNIFNSIVSPFLRQNGKNIEADQYIEFFDRLFEKLMNWQERVKRSKTYPFQVYQAIEEVHGDLLLQRQFLGLGVPMSKQFAQSTLIDKGLGVSKVVK